MEKEAGDQLDVNGGRRNERKLTFIECLLCTRNFIYLILFNLTMITQSLFIKHLLCVKLWTRSQRCNGE